MRWHGALQRRANATWRSPAPACASLRQLAPACERVVKELRRSCEGIKKEWRWGCDGYNYIYTLQYGFTRQVPLQCVDTALSSAVPMQRGEALRQLASACVSLRQLAPACERVAKELWRSCEEVAKELRRSGDIHINLYIYILIYLDIRIFVNYL